LQKKQKSLHAKRGRGTGRRKPKAPRREKLSDKNSIGIGYTRALIEHSEKRGIAQVWGGWLWSPLPKSVQKDEYRAGKGGLLFLLSPVLTPSLGGI